MLQFSDHCWRKKHGSVKLWEGPFRIDQKKIVER